MNPIPRDPFAFKARVMSAFCDDLFDMAAGKATRCERTDVLRELSRSTGAAEQAARGGLE